MNDEVLGYAVRKGDVWLRNGGGYMTTGPLPQVWGRLGDAQRAVRRARVWIEPYEIVTVVAGQVVV